MNRGEEVEQVSTQKTCLAEEAAPNLRAAFPGLMSGRVEQTILLLEHDDADIFFFRRALALVGFTGQVRVVSSFGEARDYLEGRGKFSDRRYFPMPAMIVSDLKVPGRTGMEFLQWLQTEMNFKDIPFVMYSGSATGSEAQQAVEGGARAFVQKQLDFAEAITKVREILTYMPPKDSPPDAAR